MQGINGRQIRNVLVATTRSAVLALSCLLLVTASVSSQGVPPTPPQGQPPAMDDATQALMQEFQQKQMQLGELQSQAMEANPELQTRQEEITDLVNTAIIDIDPELENHMTRLDELQTEAMAAQQAQNMETLQALVTEAQGLQSELQAAQAQALEQEELSSEIESFQEDLMVEMMEIDSEAEEILARLDELAAELNAPGPGA